MACRLVTACAVALMFSSCASSRPREEETFAATYRVPGPPAPRDPNAPGGAFDFKGDSGADGGYGGEMGHPGYNPANPMSHTGMVLPPSGMPTPVSY